MSKILITFLSILASLILHLIGAIFYGILGVIIWGCFRLRKTKYGEWLLVALFTLTMMAAFWILANHQFNPEEYLRNMELGLGKCAAMIKANELDTLRSKLETFNSSDAMKSSNAHHASVAFRNAVGAELPAGTGTQGLVAFNLFTYGFLACLAFVVFWFLWHQLQWKPEARKIFLAVIATTASLAMVLLQISSSFQNRWMLYGFKQNIPHLLEEVSKPEISPEVLHLLESPEYQGYYILLWPQPKERHNDQNKPEATDK